MNLTHPVVESAIHILNPLTRDDLVNKTRKATMRQSTLEEYNPTMESLLKLLQSLKHSTLLFDAPTISTTFLSTKSLW